MKYRTVRSIVTVVLTCALIFSSGGIQAVAVGSGVKDPFSDVPDDHWAAEYIYAVRDAGLLKGIGNNRFGMGNPLTRMEFIAYLAKLMNYPTENPSQASFSDVPASEWYYTAVESALKQGVIPKESKFYPNKAITREEMAVYSVRALGYDAMAKRMTDTAKPFSDVTTNSAYITIAKDFSLMGDTGNNLFNPSGSATREQGAGIFWNLYKAVTPQKQTLLGYYAINSYSQMSALSGLDGVAFGWSRLELDADGSSLLLNTSNTSANEYAIPAAYQQPLQGAAGKERLLMVAVSDSLAAQIIDSDVLRQEAALLIAGGVNQGVVHQESRLLFDGCLIDFETLRGSQTKENFNSFLRTLRGNIGTKTLAVAVHPKRKEGIAYYDGYDYKTIGALADKVILMAHDYNAKTLTESDMARGVTSTPLAPIDEVYYALKAVTDKTTGVADVSKVVLQLNFATAQWKLREGVVLNSTPYLPTYDQLLVRMKTDGVAAYYSTVHESPYISFYNASDDTDNIIWYENNRSIQAKIQLASQFGVNHLSLWRLGNIPNNADVEAMNILTTLLDV